MGDAGEQRPQGGELLGLDQVPFVELDLLHLLVEGPGKRSDLTILGINGHAFELPLGDDPHALLQRLQRLHHHAGQDLADGDDRQGKNDDGDYQDTLGAVQELLQAFSLGLRYLFRQGDDVLACGPYPAREDVPSGVKTFFRTRILFHEFLVVLEADLEQGELLGGGEGAESANVAVEDVLGPGHVLDVLVVVRSLIVQEKILFETPDFEGRVEKFRDGLAEDDFPLDEAQFEKGEHGQADDHRDDSVVAEGDLLPYAWLVDEHN